MKVEWAPVRELLRLERRAVEVDPASTYQEIGVRSFGKGLFIKDPVSGAEIGTKRVFEVREGDLVVSNVFGWEGAVGVGGPEHNGLIGSHRFMTWVPVGDVGVDYLAEFFRSQRGVESLAKASPGSAGRNRTLSIANFEAIQVPLPSTADQELIGAHLARLAAENVDPPAFSPQLTFREWDGVPTPIAALVEPIDRSEPVEPDREYTMQGVRWYGEGLFTRETRLGRDLSARTVRRIEPGDLVYNRLFAWKQSFAIATEPGWSSIEFPTFRVLADRVSARLLLALLLSPSFTAAVNRASSGSTPTSRNRLKEKDFLSLEVSLPDVGKQGAITHHLEIADRARPLERRARQLAAAILPAARNEIFNALR